MSISNVPNFKQYVELCVTARIALEMIAGSSYETKQFLRTFRNGAYVPVWEHACKVTHFHWEIDGDIDWMTAQVKEIVGIALEELYCRKMKFSDMDSINSEQDCYRSMYNVHKCDMYIARLLGASDELNRASRKLTAARDIAKAIAAQEESPVDTFWDAELDIVDMMMKYDDCPVRLMIRMTLVHDIRSSIERGIEHQDKVKDYADTYLAGHLSVPKLLAAEPWSPMSTMSDTDTQDTPPVSAIYVPPHARHRPGSGPQVPDATYTDLKRGTPYQMYVIVSGEVFKAKNVGYVRYALKKRMPVYSMIGGKRVPYDHATQVAWEVRNASRLTTHATEHKISERRAQGEMRLL